MTLLEKAREQRGWKRTPPKQEIDLAIAFFRGEISGGQAQAALGITAGSTTWTRMAAVLRRAVAAGRVTVTVTP